MKLRITIYKIKKKFILNKYFIPQVCRHYLVSQLNDVTLDSSIFDSADVTSRNNANNNVSRPAPSPMPPPPPTTPDSSLGSTQSNSEKPPTTPKSEPQGWLNRTRRSIVTLFYFIFIIKIRKILLSLLSSQTNVTGTNPRQCQIVPHFLTTQLATTMTTWILQQ